MGGDEDLRPRHSGTRAHEVENSASLRAMQPILQFFEDNQDAAPRRVSSVIHRGPSSHRYVNIKAVPRRQKRGGYRHEPEQPVAHLACGRPATLAIRAKVFIQRNHHVAKVGPHKVDTTDAFVGDLRSEFLHSVESDRISALQGMQGSRNVLTCPAQLIIASRNKSAHQVRYRVQMKHSA